MLTNKTLAELDAHVCHFIWFADRYLRPIFRTMFSCDGHGKDPAYIILNPTTADLFEKFRQAVMAQHDGIYFVDEIIAGKRRPKLIISYKTLNELYEKLDVLIVVGDQLCTRKSP